MRWLLNQVLDKLKRLQDAYPGAFGFMNWCPMGPFHDVVQQELAGGPNQTVVDFGCGRGAFATLFDARKYVGVDISPTFVKYAKRQHPAHGFVMTDGTHLALRDSQCDAVLVCGVLHHMTDTQVIAALREIRRILKPYGRALLIEPIPVVSRWNLPGRLLLAVDRGHFIRGGEKWTELAGTVFPAVTSYQRLLVVNDHVVIKAGR